jgi:hypothetical protein
MQRLRLLGVRDVVQISEVDGSEGEGLALPQWCDEHQFGSIVVVATKDHSRRLLRVLDRAMKGHLTRITVQPARCSDFDPGQWWKTRGVRIEIIELQKLLLDCTLHPISLSNATRARPINRAGDVVPCEKPPNGGAAAGDCLTPEVMRKYYGRLEAMKTGLWKSKAN